MQKTFSLDTMEMRNKWINELNDLFDMATAIAKGEINQQKIGDKTQTIAPKERQTWAKIAANIGAVMGNLTEAYDGRLIDKELDEMEELLAKLRSRAKEEGIETATATSTSDQAQKSAFS